MKNKFKFLATMLIGILLSVNQVWGETVNITMGNAAGKWNIQALSSSYTDTYGQKWSSSANTSSGANGSQVGSSSSTCTSLILTTTANETFQLASLTLNTAGSGNGASGSWAFTINGVSVSSGATISGSGATSVTLSSPTKVNSGEIIALTYTGTAKGVKATSLTYTYSAISADPYTVTFNAGSGTCGTSSLIERTAGAGVTLPAASPSSACGTDGWTFAGWAAASQAETTTAPTLYAASSNYKPSSNCTLYAVYSKTESSGGGSKTHTVTCNNTWSSYSSSNPQTDNQGASWTGYFTASTYSSTKAFGISKNSNNYNIASPKFAGPVKSITINASSSGTTARTVYICSSNSTPQPTSGDLGSVGVDANSAQNTYTFKDYSISITAQEDFDQFYIYASGGTYFHSITVTAGGSTTTYNSNPDCGPSTYTLLSSGHKS